MFAPVRVHDAPARRPIPYYLERLRQGFRAFRSGVRNTPLTRTLERWGDHRVAFQVGGLEVPGAWETYARILWEYIDAIDAEDDLAPFRFQRVGEMWAVQFSVAGTVKQGYFKDHKGFHHYSQLLASPHRAIESVQLAGLADVETLSLIEDEKQFARIDRHDRESVQTYRAALTLLEEKRTAAKLTGDLQAMGDFEDQIETLKSHLLWNGNPGQEPNFKPLKRQTEGKAKTALTIHKTVGTAMRRAIEALVEGKMLEVARFLETTVNPDGYGYAYRPLSPEPNWLL